MEVSPAAPKNIDTELTELFSGNTGYFTDMPNGSSSAIQFADGMLAILSNKDLTHVPAPYGGGDFLGHGVVELINPNTGEPNGQEIRIGNELTIVHGIKKTIDDGFVIFGQAKESLFGTEFGGATDGFIVKFNSDGDQDWIKSFNTSLHESISDASTDSDGNIFITGRTSNDLEEPRAGTNTWFGQSLGGRYYAAFTGKLSPDGETEWLKIHGSSNSGGLGVQASATNIMVSRYNSGQPSTYSLFNKEGDILWEKNIDIGGFAAMDAIPGTNQYAVTVASNKVGIIDSDGTVANELNAPEGQTIHDIKAYESNLYLLTRGEGDSEFLISEYNIDSQEPSRKLSVPGSSIYPNKYPFEFDLEIISDGRYLIGANRGDTGTGHGALIGQYRDYMLLEDKPEIIIRGDSLYTVVDGPSWTEAEANSVKLGGHLTTVDTEQENTWLSNNLLSENKSKENNLWIGLNDKDSEGIFTWVSGEQTSYYNWAEGEPNNHLNAEDHVHIMHLDERGKGVWNDSPVGPVDSSWSTFTERGIAEIPFIRRGDSLCDVEVQPGRSRSECSCSRWALGDHQ